MRKTVRTAVVSMAVLLALCTIVSVGAQTPDNGQGNAYIFAQNMHTTADANVMATYYNEDGSAADSIGATIPALAQKVFAPQQTGIGAPWIGSMVLYSDKELASVVNLLWDGGAYGDGKTAGYYTGFGQTSNVWYLPRIVVVPGQQITHVVVQNADDEDFRVWVRYYYRGDPTPTVEKTEIIEVGGSRHYDLGSPGGKVPNLPGLIGKSSWEGSAVVVAQGGKQIAAMCVYHWQGYGASYVGVTQPSQNLIGPRLVRRALYEEGALRWAEFGVIILQNPNDTNASVQVSFYNYKTGALDLLLPIVVPAHRIRSINLRQGGHVPVSDLDQVDTDPGPSIIWTGKVEVNSDLPILGVVQNTRGWDSGSMYAMPSLAQGSTTLYMPVAYRVLGSSGVYSRLLVANLSGAEATVDFRFYSRAGHMDYLHRRKVPGNGVKNVQMQLSPLASLGDDWIGSVYVTTNQPVVAIVDSLWAAGMERIATYNAIND